MTSTFHCHKCGRSGHWPSSCQYNIQKVRLYSGKRRGRHEAPDEEVEIVEVKTESRAARRGVYVIQHGDGQFFIGKALDIDARIIQHQNGEGAHVVQDWDTAREIHPLTDPIYSDLESWERNETLLRMSQCGIDKVRGWMFKNKVLTTPERTEAFNQVCEKFDSCRRCGRTEHHTHRCTFPGSFAGWVCSV